MDHINYSLDTFSLNINSDASAQLEARDYEHYTPILTACCYDNVRLLKVLLHYKADITATEVKEKTVLHLATEYNQLDVVKV